MYLIIMHLQKPALKDLVEKKSDLGKNTTLLPCNRFRWLREKKLGLLTNETCNFMKMFKIFKMYYLALLLSSSFCYLRSWIKSLVKILLCNHCFNLVLGAHHFSNQHDHLTPMPFVLKHFPGKQNMGSILYSGVLKQEEISSAYTKIFQCCRKCNHRASCNKKAKDPRWQNW